MPDCTPPAGSSPAQSPACCGIPIPHQSDGVPGRSGPLPSFSVSLDLPDAPAPMAPMAPARPGPERVQPVLMRTVLAGNLRRLREEAGTPLEEISKAASVIGLEWTPTWLTALEKGTKSPTADQLLALPVVLTATFGQRVTLADLLAGEAPVLLGPETAVRARHLRDLITGEPTRRPFTLPV